MDSVMPIGIILAVIAFMVFSYVTSKKRREALLLWASERGWRLRTHGGNDRYKDFPFLKLFDQGQSRKSSNVIDGDLAGLPLVLMDYQFVTGSGKSRTTHHRGLVILKLPHPVIPMSIRRENVFDKVGEFLGGGDIDFESAEFSRKFHVTSSDRKWAYDVIHTRTMDYLLSAPSHNVCFGGHEIAIIKNGHFNSDNYDEAIAMATTLHELIPDYVVQQMKGTSP
ncbi:MAG: hypothetical protein ACI9UK_001699 [Candidatus Krumholzibacteriia bacterium]|jgi:hypothetical protein